MITGDSGDNVLTGRAGADTLDGGAGNDRLVSGSGRDVLTGGEGDDTFVFDKLVTGDASILDFTPGAGSDDVIELSSSVFSNFADLLHSTSDSGRGAVITIDDHTSITLVGVQTNSLNANDFLFI